MGPKGRGRRGRSVVFLVVSPLWARVPLSLFVFWCAVFPSSVDRPEMLASWPECTRWTAPRSSSFVLVACAMLVRLVTIHLALCFLLVSPGPECSASWPIWTRRTDSSCVVVDSWQWHVHSLFCWLFCTSCCFFFVLLSSGPLSAGPPLGLHHGRYGPD